MERLAALVRFAQRHRVLELTSLTYIALPFGVFVLGWLKAWVAVPALLVVLAGLFRRPILRPGQGGASERLDPTSISSLTWIAGALAVGLVVVVVLYSGTGGYATQFGGHWRNNAFIKDLAQHPWPLGFEDVGRDHEPGVLAFYIANALLPALVVAHFGWGAGFFFQFVWTVLAIGLAILWFMRVIGSHAPRWVAFFLFFGGLDIVGFTFFIGPYHWIEAEMDLWMLQYALREPGMGGTFWLFPANLTLLFDSPHHVLCSWIVLSMIVDDAVHRGTARRIGLLCSFGLLWSAFSFVGLAPFVILALVWTRGRDMWSFENLVAGVTVLLLTGLYIASNNGDYLHGPVWAFQDLGVSLPVWFVVCVLEFGLYVLLLQGAEGRRAGLAHPAWRWTAFGTLVCVTLYRVGDNCDFTTKASVPALLVLQLCIAHALSSEATRRPVARALLMGAVLLGTFAPLTLVWRSATKGLTLSAPAIERVAPTNELERSSRGGQLFSDGGDYFWLTLARPIVYQPKREWVAPPPIENPLRRFRRALLEAREAAR